MFIIESGEWYLEKVYALRSSSKATHSNTENKSAVTYVIHIRRKVFYYFVYLIAPCMVTSFMTLILFTLPPESGERMVVGVTILLSLTVFYLLASTHIPETSEVVPLIGRYNLIDNCHPLVFTILFLVAEQRRVRLPFSSEEKLSIKLPHHGSWDVLGVISKGLSALVGKK